MKKMAIFFVFYIAVNHMFSQKLIEDIREIVMDTYEQPIPFLMDGEMCIAYELHITNFSRDSLVLNSIHIFYEDDTLVRKTYTKDLLKKSLSYIINSTNRSNDPVLLPGQRAVLQTLIAFSDGSLPQELYHRIEYNFINHTVLQKTITTIGGKIKINQNEKAIVISSPVEEGIWHITNSVADGCVGHRVGSIKPYNGIAYQRQRYAIDFIKLNEKQEAFQGDFGNNAAWFSYNSNVLAVSDAYVVDLHDEDPEFSPLIPDQKRLTKITSLAGNYIILDLGNKTYAEYAHLKPGSILVKKGDKVIKGQILAKVGSSGNSTNPHLHFAINRNTPVKGEPIPFILDSYTYMGPADRNKLINDFHNLGKGQKETLPKDNSVILLGNSDSINKVSSIFLMRQEFFYIMNSQSVTSAAQYFKNLCKTNKKLLLFSEQEMNLIGYDYLEKDKVNDAITIFQLIANLFPNSSNAYDSLGEAYMKLGDKKNAIRNYKKSIELDPNNENAKEVLKQLLK